jgi:predicted nucleic acid-binding protein
LKPSTLSYSLDSGVLIEMLLGTPSGRLLSGSLLSDSPITAYTSHFNLSEVEYILCRMLGRTQARSKVDNLVRSNYINLTDADRLYAKAAEIKCERALALGDCYTMANAKVTNSAALFAFQEEELSREIEKKPFDVEIRFMEGPPTTGTP